MLRVRREDVHEIIRAIGQQDGIEQVRVFNKEGVIMFSSDENETGKRVDMEAEACYACHAVEKPLERLSTPDSTRIFNSKEGHRVLGMITGIYNEPDCYNAECHAHPKAQTVLGVLDIVMSLDEVDRQIASDQRKILLFALIEILILSVIIGLNIRKFVVTPIKQLVKGTKAISSGDLTGRIHLKTRDEFGELADSFNKMTGILNTANQELTRWGKTLENKVEERTRELKRTQDKLIQSEKLASLGKLAAGVAHEINNPLTSVLTSASLLNEDTPEGNPIKEDLEIIISETKRCRSIIRDLLDFARQNKPKIKEANINTVIEGTLAILKYQAFFQNIAVVKNYEKQLPYVWIDADQFQQVFMNIIMNSAEAMSGRGTLTIETRLSEGSDFIEVCFNDTGPGIKKENMDKLFDPFFTTKEFGKGTGLGLAVSYGIVQRHGGAIKVQSEEGKGATFIVTIPAKRGTEEEGM